MAEFKSDNGKFGTKRISRTATGYKGTMQLNTEGGVNQTATLTINRGVGEDGDPYIELEIAGLDDRAKIQCTQQLLRAFAGKGLRAEKANSIHGVSNMAIHVKHNVMIDAFEGLLQADSQENGLSLSEGFAEFVREQEQVRNGLEQSLMFAFGNDCHLKPKGKVPKNEVNRIQRLAQYFRSGAPEIKEHFQKGAQPTS
ncbi:MAG: hypothetical protein EB060_04350 [Proteobacteria bacterium]|nr:hypothetical protein [Pseudomonadota bacterium]